MKQETNTSLRVMLWGQEIGRLAWHQNRKTTYFLYNPEFLKGDLDVAPLMAPIHNPQSTRAIFGEQERIYQKLPSFIADSLPDDWGNKLFEYWRKENGLTASEVTPLQKLAFIGKRGMGALEFMPDIDRGEHSSKVDIKALSDLARKIQMERENASISPEESLTLQSLVMVGTSAGGRQPKAIIAINRETGEIRSGQIETGTEYEYYILKFGNDKRSTAELEQTYYNMAIEAGINMMASQLIEVEGTHHFLTSRFDRNANGKLHAQTLAAMYPEADTYEKLLMVCRKLHLPEVDCQEVFRRLVFNILANNTDDHNKNFSFIMDHTGRWRLSPAYDLTYIFDDGGYLPLEEHCMMMGGKLRDITKEDIIQFASENGIPHPDSIIRNVVKAIQQFRPLALKNGVKEEWIGRVESTLAKHLASWGYDATAPATFAFIDKGGRTISEVHLEQMYKGNYHLLANIDGHNRKFVIRKDTPLAGSITQKGLANIDEQFIKNIIEQHLR
ncbi:MAG: type II toxin-antitoxin system HipA family toxin [Prevotella sp.]|nr:type II toxin-antitoxin system HipA family toxin [Prevotella sp.]MCH4240938.1 type II toxin-antitoxin system HipA family toxin [Prevotella sp.]